jgi:hypothetical protein
MKDKASNKTPKMKWWKITGFALGILLIAAAATYALTTRNSAASSGPLTNGTVPSIGSNTSQSAPAAMGVGDLNWVQNLAAKFTDHDFIFVILPENDSSSTNTLANRVAEATVMIEARGARVDTMTLSASDPEFSITTERLAITQLPAVLATSVSGNGVILTGDITVGKLLQTYLVVSQPVCAPGSSPGCCGGK